MISEKQLPELGAYRKLETLLPIDTIPQLSRLVVAATNDQLPVHRWFRFKEGFSADLLKNLLPALSPATRECISILDPFSGVGTTLLSAQELSRFANIKAVGIERNPFIHFVSKTKLAWPLMRAENVRALSERILRKSSAAVGNIPRLSSLVTGRCMSRHNAQRLVGIRDAIRADGNSPDHDALLLGLAGAIEQLSKTRKDGRALRLVERPRQSIVRVLREKWQDIASDIKFMQQLGKQAAIPTVHLGDGRTPAEYGIESGSVDMLLTSPPYPNNIDYTEVYKLELWLLGLINDSGEFLGLRKKTFHSHPTAGPRELDDQFSEELNKGKLKVLLNPIIQRTKSSSEQYRHKLVIGYAFDLWLTLRAHHSLLKEKGVCVIVVGNSLHGGKHLPYLIPADLMVAALAEITGYKVKNVAIARNFLRRLSGNHFLRESMLVLEKE